MPHEMTIKQSLTHLQEWHHLRDRLNMRMIELCMRGDAAAPWQDSTDADRAKAQSYYRRAQRIASLLAFNDLSGEREKYVYRSYGVELKHPTPYWNYTTKE